MVGESKSTDDLSKFSSSIDLVRKDLSKEIVQFYRIDQRFSESRNLNLRMVDEVFEFRFCSWQWQEIIFNKK